MKYYEVLSRKYEYIDYIEDLGCGPSTDERDWIVVAAPNKQKAKVCAVRSFRKYSMGGLNYDENPFTGIEVTEITEEEAMQHKEYYKDQNVYFEYEGAQK